MKKNKDLENFLKDKDYKYLDNIYLELLNNYTATVSKIGKMLTSNIMSNNIDDAIVIINNLSRLVNDEEKMKKVRKVIEINYQKSSTFSEDDMNVLMYLIFEYKDYELIKYFLFAKENSIKLYKVCLEKILSNFLLLEKDDEDILYYEKLIELFIYNSKPQEFAKNRTRYLQMIIRSANFNLPHVKRIYNRINIYDNINLREIENKYKINFGFSSNAILESAKLGQDFKKRVDLTKQDVITIDGAKSVIIDDAFYMERLDDGNYKLYVHIADVASYIKEDGFIDKEAYIKGENIYLIDNNISMLPSNMASHLCSLKKAVRKNVITYEVSLDSDFNFMGNKITDFLKIYPSFIRVKENHSYQSADRLIKGEKSEVLTDLLEFSNKLKKENPNKEIYRNIENKLDRINYKVKPKESTLNNISSSIVQELMVLTNYIVASYFDYIDMPFVFRNSKRLSKDELNNKLMPLYKYVDENNFKLKELSINNIKNVIDIISRSAYYSLENAGHFGLGYDAYSHSTSPIRRYADIVNQRLIYDFVLNNNISNNLIYEWEEKIKEISVSLNEKEKNNEMFASEYNFLVKRKKLRK